MDKSSYCCGQDHIFVPRVMPCYGNLLCTILRDAKYYGFESRYNYCRACFNDIPGEVVVLGDDASSSSMIIKKSQFQELKNDVQEPEPLVQCVDCGRKQHQICTLHLEQIWSSGFECDLCLEKKGLSRNGNEFTAKRLQTTKLSDYIEARVNIFLEKKEAGAGKIVIRVVSCRKKSVEVKARMKTRFVESGQLPAEFPYRAKVLLAFKEIDGVDVCFFGMYVQEYGSNSPAPNNRRVYLAYLDSVHFFEPRQYRTAVYHEILLGYLKYVRHLGYTMAHIWACSPSDGEDYIFYSHPTEQKIPNPKRLRDWCIRLLNKGILERIVLDYKDIHKQAFEDHIESPVELPYFEGDFWPNVMEESIKELDQEEEEKRKQEKALLAAEAASAAAGNKGGEEEEEMFVDGKTEGQKKQKTISRSKSQVKIKSENKNSAQCCNDLAQKIFVRMKKHKDVFFVIRLHSARSAVSLPPIQDPDPTIVCDLMDGRDAFLTLASKKHWEFSSLRRAKFSAMTMLYEMHRQRLKKCVSLCNSCGVHTETFYHCHDCDDFYLCNICHHKEGHQHKMIKILDIDNGSCSLDNKDLNSQEDQKIYIMRCIEAVDHSAHCSDSHCLIPTCQKMKIVLLHTKVCETKINGGCSICQKIILLCCAHSIICTNNSCAVPYCCNIKQKEWQQKLQPRLQLDQLEKYFLQSVNPCTLGAAGTASTLPSVNKPVVQAAAPAYNQEQPLQQSSPVAETGLPAPAPSQPPGGQAPFPNVLEAVKECDDKAMNQMVDPLGEPNSMVQQAVMRSPQQTAQQQPPNRSLPGMEQVWNRYSSAGPVGNRSCSGGIRPTMKQGAP